MSLHILILAAGQGKRMHSRLPKVLHPILFQPMLHHVLDVARAIPHDSVSVIVGHGEEQVRAACEGYQGLQFFRQTEQRGTAHAVRVAEPFLAKQSGDVLILSGDVPLLQKSSLESLLRVHREMSAALSFFTASLDRPAGYGRVLRSGGKVTGVREAADCTPPERALREVNAGIYCFRLKEMLAALARIGSGNKQGEFYLTDAIGMLVADGARVEGVGMEDPREMSGVNDRADQAEVETLLQSRINRAWMLKGVSLEDPGSVRIDARSQLAADVRIEAGVRIIRSRIGAGSVVEAGSRIVDCTLAACTIKQGSYLEQSEVGEGSTVGPYAHLRPGSQLGRDVKIGNFVELKKAKMGDGSKASHLAYIGDAEIGRDSNLGCGFITCNFDGVHKHFTTIEEEVFVGSDSQMVAPVHVGRGSYIAAGSTITKAVPPDSLAFSRGRQVNKVGYAAKYRRQKD